MNKNQTHEDTIILHFSKGNSTMGDWEILYKFAENRQVKVELGTALGFATMILAIHSGKVYTIDNHTFYTQNNKYTSNEKYQIIKNFTDLYCGDNIKVIKNDTIKEAENWENESIELLFIDAGHIYNQVKADYFAWYPKIKKDAVILIHDVNQETIGVWEFWNDDIQKEIQKKKVKELIQKSSHHTVMKVLVKL